MDSTLLAQLAADKKHSRFAAPSDWYDSYLSTLSHLTWQISGFTVQQYVPSGDMFTLEEVVLDTLKGLAAEGEVDIVREAIRTFDRLPEEDRRVLVYEQFSRSSHIIDLQVSVANDSSTLLSLGVVLETEQKVAGLFREEIPVSQLVGQIRTLLFRGSLSAKAYAPLRKEVIDKLGARRQELILSLDLS